MEYETFRGIVERIRTERFQMEDIVPSDFNKDVIGQIYVFAKIGKLGEGDIETAESYAHAVLVSFNKGFYEGQRKTLEYQVNRHGITIEERQRQIAGRMASLERRTTGKGEDAD